MAQRTKTVVTAVVVAVVIVAIIVASALLGTRVVTNFLHPTRPDNLPQSANDDVVGTPDLMTEYVYYTSSDTHDLMAGTYLHYPDADNDTPVVIMVHDLFGTRADVLPVADIFLREGYRVLAVEQRSPTSSTGFTYGAREKSDIADWIEFIRRDTTTAPIGVWGVGTGATTVALAVADYPDIDFAIVESPYRSADPFFDHAIATTPTPMKNFYTRAWATIMLRLRTGHSLSDMSITDQDFSHPTDVLVIASKADTDVPPQQINRIVTHFNDNNLNVVTWSDTDSPHSMIINNNFPGYEAAVTSFLRDVVTNK